MSDFVFGAVGANVWRINTDGIIGDPNMGNHMEDYRFNKLLILVPSIFRDKDHIYVDPWCQFFGP